MSVLVKKYSEKSEAIITTCFVVMPNGVTDNEGHRRYCRIDNAAWDTGATNTIISPEIVKSLDLKPSGKCSISAYGGSVDVSTYKIDLCFENGIRIVDLEVMSGEEHDGFDYDVLIGMDVITQGDFCVSTINGETSFFFRIPAEGIKL